MSERRDGVRAQCERIGVSGALSLLADLEGKHETIGFVREWIDETLRNESAAREEAQRLLSEQAVAAAQLSASTSATAAEASRQAARWTMIAGIAAAASAIISAAVPIATILKWLPK